MIRSLACLCFFLCATAFAQTPSPRPRQPPRVQVIDLTSTDVIEGTTQSPDLEIYTAKPHPVFQSLIKVRTNFDDRILASVDEL